MSPINTVIRYQAVSGIGQVYTEEISLKHIIQYPAIPYILQAECSYILYTGAARIAKFEPFYHHTVSAHRDHFIAKIAVDYRHILPNKANAFIYADIAFTVQAALYNDLIPRMCCGNRTFYGLVSAGLAHLKRGSSTYAAGNAAEKSEE
jgi:hypothetical protein